MHERSTSVKISGTALLFVTTFTLTACETTSNWLRGRKTAEPETVMLGAPEANSYLTELYALVNGDPYEQTEIFEDAKAGARLTPDPTTRLRYALVLATPGHSATDESQAQSMLRDLLSQTEMMSAAEVSLASIYLNDVEQRLVLRAEARRVSADQSRATSTEDAAVAQRIATVEAENRRLKQSLAEAESKLQAITNIERSIRDAQPEGN